MKNEELPCSVLVAAKILHSSFFILHLFSVLFNLRFCIRVIHIFPFHRFHLFLQVLEGNEQSGYDEYLQYHTD